MLAALIRLNVRMSSNRLLSTFLAVSLFCLALAASTGVLLRFGMIYGMPAWAQNFAAVRHAHSHLMYFGWVMLALMAFIWSTLPKYTNKPLPRQVTWQMAATSVAAILSYPAFWQNGYGLTQVGTAHLPLGAMVSTINGLTWFWFIALYVRATRGLPARPLPIQLWDWGIMLLILASLGAAGLIGMVMSRADSAFLQQLFLHQFLDLFAVGWFSLAMLGLLWSSLPAAAALPRWLPTMSLALLLAPTFVLGISPALLPPHLFWLAALCNAAAAGLLTVHLVRYLQRTAAAGLAFPRLQWLGLGSLAVIIVIAFTLLVPGVWSGSATGPMRIFYLHDFLLGWISTMLIAAIGMHVVSRAAYRWAAPLWVIGTVTMLAALLALGLAGSIPLSALAMLQLAAWASVPVAAAAILLWIAALVALRRPPKLALAASPSPLS